MDCCEVVEVSEQTVEIVEVGIPGPAGADGFGSLSDATPLADGGAGDPGTSDEASRADHVHPASGGGGSAIGTGHWSALPGSPAAGDLYLPDDAPVISRYNGFFWSSTWGPIFPLSAPYPVAGFDWVNQGASTAVDNGPTIFLLGESSGGDNFRILKQSGQTVITLLMPGVGNTETEFGMCWRESSSGKLVLLRIYRFNQWYVSAYSDPSTFSSHYASGTTMANTRPIWCKLEDDGTNRISSISVDGLNWQVLDSHSNTDFMVADEVGFFVSSGDAGVPSATLLSWYQPL